MFTRLIVAGSVVFVGATMAQNRVGPIRPANKIGAQESLKSGQDPFTLDLSTGRFVYSPLPYDVRSGPFAFNWYSGQWNYIPQEFNPAPGLTGRAPQSEARIAPAQTFTLTPQSTVAPGSAVQASESIGSSGPAPIVNRSIPVTSRGSLRYTTSDTQFNDWYGSTSSK